MFSFFTMLFYLSQFSFAETNTSILPQTEDLLQFSSFKEESKSIKSQFNRFKQYKEEKKKKTHFKNTLFLSWKDYFSGDPPSSLNSNYWYRKQYSSNSQILPKQNTAYFLKCKFVDFKSIGKGGVIQYQIAGKFLLEFSFFHRCYSTDLGGAVETNLCDCVTSSVCSTYCNTLSSGSFMSAKGSSTTTINKLLHSSVSIGTANDCPVELYFGDQTCKNDNISHIYVQYQCGLYLQNSGANQATISYCELYSIYATKSRTIYTRREGITYLITKCNLINCKQGTAEDGIIRAEKPTTISDCSFSITDTSIAIFFVDNAWSGGQITVVNCSLPQGFQTKTSNGGSINVNAAHASKSFTHSFSLTADPVFCKVDIIATCQYQRKPSIIHPFIDIVAFHVHS